MAAAHYYRILGLRTGADFEAVKLAYRNLARLYHPDVNPGDHLAKEKFVQITQAYQAIVDDLPAGMSKVSPRPARPAPRETAPQTAVPTARVDRSKPLGRQPVATAASASMPSTPPPPSPGRGSSDPSPPVQPPPAVAESDQDLKQSSFKQLQALFQAQRYPRAVALVEGLAYRFPNDPEIRQWHAITYYRWGQMSLNHGHWTKAAACLKKAARLDPLNRALQESLQQEWRRLDTHSQSPVVSAHG